MTGWKLASMLTCITILGVRYSSACEGDAMIMCSTVNTVTYCIIRERVMLYKYLGTNTLPRTNNDITTQQSIIRQII